MGAAVSGGEKLRKKSKFHAASESGLKNKIFTIPGVTTARNIKLFREEYFIHSCVFETTPSPKPENKRKPDNSPIKKVKMEQEDGDYVEVDVRSF